MEGIAMREYLLLVIWCSAIVCVTFMSAAFVIIALRGGWQKAMQSDPMGRWSLARKLMLIGAASGFISSILMLIFQALGGFRA
jgi:hypothetical protein